MSEDTEDDNFISDDTEFSNRSISKIATKINNTFVLDLNQSNMFYIESNKTTNDSNISIINLPFDTICTLNIKLFFKTNNNPYLTNINASNKNLTFIKGNVNTFERIIPVEINYTTTSNLTLQTFKIVYDPILTNIFNIKSEVSSY